MIPVFGDPPKNTPPQISPPVCKIWRFLGPPPDPPFLRTPPFSRGYYHPWSSTPVWPYDVVLSFDLLSWWWSSSSIIILDFGYTYKIFIILINFYKYSWLQSMVQGAPPYIRLHGSSSRVLLQKNTSPLPITMAKPAFLYHHTAQERIPPLYIGYIYPFLG